jgi:hypothetical protein
MRGAGISGAGISSDLGNIEDDATEEPDPTIGGDEMAGATPEAGAEQSAPPATDQTI